MMKLHYQIALACSILLSSCAVYVPTVPSTPLVTEAGQVEVTAGIRSFSSLEVGGAWSPTNHLFVTVETALQTSNGSETTNGATFKYTNVHKQASVGLGTYRLFGPEQKGYLAATAGFGLAKADVYDPHLGYLILPIFGRTPITYYEASYQRYYGQLYTAHLGRVTSYGASLRGTFVHYSLLRRNDVGTTTPSTFFLEPTFFIRVGSGPLQFQSTVGLSAPTQVDYEAGNRNNLSPTSVLISAGLVFRPHLLHARTVE